MNLQRSVAQMTPSALQWQQTAQERGVEMTRSMLDQVPGQEFTQSMLESYLQGMEAMMPEMERALEQGAAAGMAAQTGSQSQSGFQPQSRSRSQPQQQAQARAPPTRSAQRGGQQPPMEGHTAQMRRRQPSTGETDHPTGEQYTERARQQRGQQPQQRQSQQPMAAYPQTGEWIDREQSQSQPRQSQGTTYGGESASATGPEHYMQENQSSEQPTARHDQERRPEQQNERSGHPAGRLSPQQGRGQQNQHSQRAQQSPEQSRDQPSQRIDSGTGGSHSNRGPQRAGQQRAMSQQPTQQDLEATDREIESTRTGHEQDRDRG